MRLLQLHRVLHLSWRRVVCRRRWWRAVHRVRRVHVLVWRVRVPRRRLRMVSRLRVLRLLLLAVVAAVMLLLLLSVSCCCCCCLRLRVHRGWAGVAMALLEGRIELLRGRLRVRSDGGLRERLALLLLRLWLNAMLLLLCAPLHLCWLPKPSMLELLGSLWIV